MIRGRPVAKWAIAIIPPRPDSPIAPEGHGVVAPCRDGLDVGQTGDLDRTQAAVRRPVADLAINVIPPCPDGPIAPKGGDLGSYRPGWVEPAVEAALAALKPGMVSEPVQTPSGFHLVKLIGREPESAAEVAAVRERLRQELYAEKQRQRFEALLAKLRGTAAIRMADASRFVTEDAGPLPVAPAP